MLEKLKRILKKSKSAQKVYEKTKQNFIDINIGEITPFNVRKSNFDKRRLNILVPSINKEHVFGGISTALKFYDEIAREGDFSKRIILTDAMPSSTDLNSYKEYNFIKPEQESNYDFEIVPFNDRYNKTIPVGSNDYFIATSWWTAYFSQRIVNWQASAYNQEIKKMIYFIQDFEPGFYPWSSRYLLAESTYKYEGDQITVFNTKLLKDYINDKGYKYNSEFVFEPRLNEKLKNEIEKQPNMIKKKKIIIYGRPSVKRNAFELIIESLKQWVWIQPDANEWEILSAGENHPDVNLGNNIKVKSVGKLSLEDYATLLKEAYAGISLMVSPHPSYPPLEMAAFGVKVITNTYDNKNITLWNKNIISLDNITPENIATHLSEICAGYNKQEVILPTKFNNKYLANDRQFDFSKEIVDLMK